MTKFPEEVLNCGGLIGEIMDYTLDQAFRPNRQLAFAGALCWVAHCMGRVYRTTANGRPNIYLLAHAWSGVGKSAPRDTNFKLAKACGMVKTVIEDFRSGEALQDAVLQSAKILSQYDEADTLFDSIKKSSDTGVGINTLGEMLKEWEKSKNFMVRRKLAASVKGRKDDQTPDMVYHPHLTLFMTGVTSEVYKSISDKMAKNGFFARLLVIDGGMRGGGKTPIYRELPPEIVERCKTLSRYQSDYTAWGQMRGDWDGTGEVIHMTMDAEDFRAAFVHDAEAHYNTEEDGVENAVWNRTVEKAEKLAMIFAASDNQDEPKMDIRHWQLARQLVEYSNAHQIEMLAKYSSETDYEDLQKRILRRLEKGITCNRALLSFLKIRNEDLREAMETLQAAGKVIFCNENGEEMPEWKRGISYALA